MKDHLRTRVNCVCGFDEPVVRRDERLVGGQRVQIDLIGLQHVLGTLGFVFRNMLFEESEDRTKIAISVFLRREFFS